MYKLKAAEWRPQHFHWEVKERVATVTLNRPERKNPLTFESYAELRDTFHRLQYADDVRAVVFTGEGGNFCSGGDVHEIIGPLVKMDMPQLMAFTRMTGSLVREMRTCPQPVIAAVDGVCAGAGAIISMASDAGRVGSLGETVYSGTKGGVIAFTKALAREMARYDITVNCVCPGPTDTPLMAAVPDKIKEAFARVTPMRRLAKPSEVADAILFFASAQSDFVTGQVLSVSGGLTMAG